MKWGVVILAGGRERGKFAAAIGEERKANVMFGPQSSLNHLLQAVRAASLADSCVTVTGKDVHVSVGLWAQEGSGAIENAGIGIDSLPDADAFLVLPSDSPMLIGQDLTHFMRKVEDQVLFTGKWVACGLAESNEFRSTFPTVPNKPSRFKDGEYGAGALYACSRLAFTDAKSQITKLRELRKNPFMLVAQIGFLNLIKFAVGQMSLEECGRLAEKLLNCDQAIIICDCHPRTLLDFDNIVEYESLLEFFS